MTKPSEKAQVVNKSKNEETLRVLLEEINGLESHVNPIIAKLSNIYKNRKRYIGSGDALGIEIKNKEGYILASDSDGIFEDTKLVLELNALESGKLVTKKHVIETEEFQTSALDVLIAHFQIMVKNDNLHFTDTDKSLNIEKLDDILFIKAYDKKAILFTTNNKYVVSNLCIGDFCDLLKDNSNFLLVHRSYLVNTVKIRKISQDFKILFPVGLLSIDDLINDYKLLSKENKDNIEILEEAHKVSVAALNQSKNLTQDELRVRVKQMQKDYKSKILNDVILYDKKRDKMFFKIPIVKELQDLILDII